MTVQRTRMVLQQSSLQSTRHRMVELSRNSKAELMHQPQADRTTLLAGTRIILREATYDQRIRMAFIYTRKWMTLHSCRKAQMASMMGEAGTTTLSHGFSASNTISSPNEPFCLPTYLRLSLTPILWPLSEVECCWIFIFVHMIVLQASLSWKRLQLMSSSATSSVMTSTSVERGWGYQL